MIPPLPRSVKYTIPKRMVGLDVEAHARAMHRYLADGQLDDFVQQKPAMRRTFGIGKRTLAKKCAKKAKLPEYGVVGPGLYEKMQKAGAYDDFADSLLVQYAKPKVPSLVYPQAYLGTRPSWLHETGGIRGNWALDWIAPPGTPVLAPMSGIITRTAGYPPGSGTHGDHGDVFGWSIYLRCLTGFYYMTHFGELRVTRGSMLKPGQLIGYVGHWPRDIGRSHTHCGFTNIAHIKSLSIAKIRATAAAPVVDIQGRL